MDIFKRFKFLEWLWFAHAGLGLMLLVCDILFVGSSVAALAVPLLFCVPDFRLLLGSGTVWGSFILYGMVLLNGGVFYLIAKVFFEKQILGMVRRFRFLEWLWVAHAVLGLLLLCGGRGGGGVNLLALAAGLFMFPVVLLIPDWVSMFSQVSQGVIHSLAMILNGGLFYWILRLCFRRKKAPAAAAP